MPASKKPSDDKGRHLRQVGLLGTIPLLLAAGPLVGYLIGQWLDNWLGTSPYLLILFLTLGFAASVKEITNIIKKASKDSE